ncbi:hypothetical protein HZA42_03650 [Candidatus Peregrinibacteria bacterium]|nr:hypothetical protein [Candidatus Peregrinibacteria bacterium]
MGPFIFLDTETTGVDASRDHIIEIAGIKWQDGKILDKFETLVNPHVPIPQEIILLTGIDDQAVADAPIFADIKLKLADFIGNAPIAGHNIAFDIGFFKSHHAHFENPEIDTVQLARILLPKEASYALAVLMKKCGLCDRESHRAMADTETAIEFFEFLLEKIKEISPDKWNVLDKLFKKSSWAGKMAFEKAGCVAFPSNIFLRKQSEPHAVWIASAIHLRRPPQPKRSEGEEAEGGLRSLFEGNVRSQLSKVTWQQSAIDAFLAGKKILLESAYEIPLASLKGEKLILAYSRQKTRADILQGAENANISISELKDPRFYISPKKLSEKIASGEISAEETPLLAKLVLWSSQTETGDRGEITLERTEYAQFDLLADTEKSDGFFKKALVTAQKSDIILTHHYGLANGLCDDFSSRSLIILDGSELEDNFTGALKKRYTEADLRPIFGEKATILFGFLGIFHDRFSSIDYGGFRGSAMLDKNSRRSMEWQRAISVLENLPDNPKKAELLTAFASQENTTSWVVSFANEVSFTSAPILLAETFKTRTAQFKKILIHSGALSGDGTFGLVRDLFELDSTWHQIKEDFDKASSNLNVKIPEKFPEPNSEGYFVRCTKLFIEIMEEKKGRILFLANSKKTVEAMYQALLPELQDRKINLLAVGLSGGVGKSLALFLDDPEHSALLTTNQILPYFHEIEDKLDVIIFQKIPFDPLSDPLISARGKLFENSFEQYSIPRAASKFRELMLELGKGTPKTCYLLDSRVLSRAYGQLFI